MTDRLMTGHPGADRAASDWRGQFLLDPAVTFLNHGSYGACPRVVIAAWQDLQRQSEAQPVAFHDPRALAPRHAATRRALGAALGADPANIAPAVNATQALAVAIGSLDLEPGDEVLTTDHEYAALDKAWAAQAQSRGIVIRRVTVPLPLHSETAFTDTVIGAMTDRTKVLFLSHITSATALLFPVAAAVLAARQRGITTVIDGAHTPGQIDLDLTALDADFYAGNCHKWLLAPKGAAFLHVRPDWQPRVRPLAISHGWTPNGAPWLDLLEIQGTRDATAWFSVPAALKFRNEGWADALPMARKLARETLDHWSALTGTAPICAPEFQAPQMALLRIPDCDTLSLHDRLLAEFGIEVPVMAWGGQSFVRVSVQPYTLAAECERLITALQDIIGV